MPDKKTGGSPAKFQRKTILIKKGLQYKYMSLILVSVFIAFLIVGLDIIWTISKFVGEHPMVQPLLTDITDMAPLFGIKIFIYLLIVVIVSAVVSHRMAGPIFKFEKSAKTLASGDLTHRVSLRQGDHLTELQDSFNLMAESLQSAIAGDKAIVDGSIGELKKLASETKDAETKAKIEKVADNLSKAFTSVKV